MTDYTELVKALRCGTSKADKEHNCEKCRYYSGTCLCTIAMNDAAAAIEALEAEVEEQKQIAAHYEQTAKDWWKEACEYHTIVSAKDITAEESEELIRKFKKLPCGPIEPNEPNCADVVEVVRCKDCKHGLNTEIGKYCGCAFRTDDWFCADGIRKKDEQRSITLTIGGDSKAWTNTPKP